jgi:Fe-S oxidoreductase/FAD/FMN-containing dehydrogenase
LPRAIEGDRSDTVLGDEEVQVGKLSQEMRSHLELRFGDRVSFRETERKLYGHDIAAIPSLVRLLVGNTTPDAVVQPKTEDELIDLVKWASSHNLPITPRAKASSGYGGAIPVKQGLVVDLYRLNGVLAVDREGLTVRVQAGIVWERLDRELAKHGLTLRAYPTSYPASTVGGWLAQGGAGIGSFEAGWFRKNVVGARVVLPDGSVREFSDRDLDLVSEAEGITGLISEVTVRVQPLEDLGLVAIGCPNANDLQKLAESMIAEQLPIWSMVFINPRMAELKNRAPLREHAGHPAEERVLLPASYIMTLAFRESDREAVMGKLPYLLRHCEAEVLSDRIAEHEWDHRFQLMVVKRLGPSLVPAEVVIPLSALGDVMREIEAKIDQPVVKEGVIVREGANGKPEVVILGFIPSDQRKFSYNFVFGLVLTILKIAERHGGRPYSTGMYFSSKAKDVMGEDRVRRLKELKSRVDPKGILNPGKVLGSGMLGAALALAYQFEPLVRPFGNHVITHVGERPMQPVKDIPADVAWYAYSCSQCGYCVETCDQFYGRGWESQSPRGKWYWLREYMEGREKWDQAMVNTILACTTCEICNTRCSAALPIEPSWMKLRGQLIQEEKKMTFPPFEMMAEAIKDQGNIWAGYRTDRDAWFPNDLEEKHGPDRKASAVYFAGCTASYVEKDIAIGSARLLDAAGVDYTYIGKKENCCGTPMLVAGKWDLFAETMRKNVAAVKNAGADTVITSCPACDMMWRQVYPEWAEKEGIEYGIKTKHYSEVVAEKIHSGEFVFPDRGKEPVTVTWHDSCHIGRASGVYEPPRDVIKAVPNANFVEMPYNREEAHCCGSVLSLLDSPAVAADIGMVKLQDALDAGADKILALCPCCQVQMRVTAKKKQTPVEIIDLAHFAAEALGYDLPDPNPEMQKQWAVFEAFIALMTPKGFARLMGTMWPELIDSMPFGMGPMMRVMGKIPGSLDLMKPMLPVLFPRLLPMMMPKVMDTMLQRVADQIEMPGYMLEQMPDMMPKVMDSLMPHMIGDLVPLVTQPMIDYLRGKPLN